MFHRYGKKLKSSQTKPLNELTRVIPAALLLAEDKRELLVRQIKNICALDEPRFDSLCLSLMHNLVNHCQSLPETSTSYYSQQAGLIDHALNRTEAALSLFQQYLLLDARTELSEEQKLWQYALFSAAILQGIGKLYIDYRVDLYDSNGQLLKQWNPVLENLATVGSYYSYEFLADSDEEFRRRLNLLLARFLMPASGFAWIASNPQVLAVWLALLNEDEYAAGTLGAILIRANAIAIQRYFNQVLLRSYGSRGGRGRYGRVGTFTGGVPAESVAEIEQQLGIEFIQWLSKALDGGIVMINKAPLLMVPGGLLMTPEIFQMYVRDFPDKSWLAVQNAFLSLGMHRLGVDGSTTSRFEQSSNHQMHTGIVFADYAVALPSEVQLNNMHTGKAVALSATELIHQVQNSNNHFVSQHAGSTVNPLLHLDASGRWQAGTIAAPSLSQRAGVTNGV